jgi:hypothetical protein
MRHLWWLIPFVAALAVIRLWWAGTADVPVLVTLVCGFAGLIYLVMRNRGPLPPPPAGERDRRDVQRDIPPPSN